MRDCPEAASRSSSHKAAGWRWPRTGIRGQRLKVSTHIKDQDDVCSVRSVAVWASLSVLIWTLFAVGSDADPELDEDELFRRIQEED